MQIHEAFRMCAWDETAGTIVGVGNKKHPRP